MPTMDSQRATLQFAGALIIGLLSYGPAPMRILILGGTSEASALARRLAGDERFAATLSLAGRTSRPMPQPLATRIGGFGGAQGLAQWLVAERIEAVVDATHPYADRISANAVAACRDIGVDLVSIARTPWQPEPGDHWIDAASAGDAAHALGAAPRRVFLSLGRLELPAFAAAPQHHYIARTIDPAGDVTLPPDIRFIYERGPFDRDAERAFLVLQKVEAIVSKNSGGSATYGKIAAARALTIPVFMIARPVKSHGPNRVETPEAALAWLETRLRDTRRAHATPPVSRREV
jgi:precorrin-6A/cobalt-precorrin-6A reductase